MTARSALAGVLALGLLLTGCGAESAAEDDPAAGDLSGTVVVFAAASLTDVFTALGEQFEAANSGVTVEFNFAGSSTLAAQINQGAPADVFASASPAQTRAVVDAGGITDEPTVFVRNTLQIVVPAGNPAAVTGLEDFTDAELTLALCAAEVPCGAAAATVFQVAGLTPQPDTLEQDVRAALTKVELGEVDAALVYRTDVLAGGDQVEGIDFPESAEAVNDYPIAVLAEAPNPDAAAVWVEWVLSEQGRSVLEEAGFQLP